MVDRSNSGRSEFGAARFDQNLDGEASSISDVTVFEARLETVLETAVDGIIVTNDRGRVLMFNKACEKMFGYRANDVVGHNATMLMPPRHARTHDQYVSSYLKEGREGVVGRAHEVMGRHAEGRMFPIELTIGEAHTPAGRQFIGVLRDLRQRHETQTRLDELQRELVQLSRRNAVEEMGTAMAHELNQPLTAMTLYLQAIEKKTRDLPEFGDDIREILSKALRETERAGQIIQSVRRFSKRAAKRSEPTDIKQLVLEALELTMVGYRTRGVKVSVDIAKSISKVSVDAVQIQQILVNLLRNALDAILNERKPKIWVSAWQDAGFVSISVRDSGDGIAENAVDNLFTTFSSSKETGMGLGLAISNTIAQSHGGCLDVEPGGNGMGATFTLKLPLDELYSSDTPSE